MSWLSLKNNRLKFETSGEVPIIWEESLEYISNDKAKLEDVNM